MKLCIQRMPFQCKDYVNKRSFYYLAAAQAAVSPEEFPNQSLAQTQTWFTHMMPPYKGIRKKHATLENTLIIHDTLDMYSDHGLFRMTSPFATSATTWNRPPCLENILKWQHTGMFLHEPSREDYSSLREFFECVCVCVCAPVLNSFADTILRCFRLSWLLIVYRDQNSRYMWEALYLQAARS